ncbi:hypothetical protein H0H93_010509 [Arthromyces matolae]|nr:hypothetical protein H0H93_010509 [Arthromyces matolae]
MPGTSPIQDMADATIAEVESTDLETDDTIQALSDLGEQLITLILSDGSAEAVQALIDADAPLWYQNDEGMSPLHAAAYMQNPELVKMLIDRGAVWNAVDNLQFTAGDISLSFNDEVSYTLIRNAGIRSGECPRLLSHSSKELLLSLLASKSSIANPTTLLLKESDSSATGSTQAFLSSKLTYVKDDHGQDICLLKVGAEDVGVMMGWERDIMQRTVHALCNNHPSTENLKVLNIGFGLGIIDTLFQSLPTKPAQHVIVEPHPDVLRFMKEQGWYEKPGVTILEGKWQDHLDSDIILGVGGFDIVYTDTFSEDYSDLRQFFESLPDLLAGPESRMSFFNGLGATNALFYDVYSHIAELHLAEVGIDVDWFDIDVSSKGGDDRWGESRNYFSLPLYFLPIGHLRVDWHRTRRPKPAIEGGILPAVSQSVAPPTKTGTRISGFTSPRDTLTSGSGIVVAVNDLSAHSPVTPILQTPAPPVSLTSTGLPFDEEAKLVYGVVLSLRNMVKKLAGREEQFTNFRTSAYKLHLYETVSGYKFVMLSDPNTESLRFLLRQIFNGPFLEYVVRNPLVKMDSREYGVDNEYFRASIDRLVRGLANFS